MNTAQPKKVKIAFADFGNSAFDSNLTTFISERLPVEITRQDEADFLFYGDFGIDHHHFKGIKIFYTGENHPPRWIETDYALTHERMDNTRNMRLPYWMSIFLIPRPETELSLIQRPPLSLEDLAQKPRKFASFVYRNHVCKTRNNFFHHLNKYKRVDSAGPWLNNMPDNWLLPREWEQTREFISNYKFTISFENESHPGYTTEKITYALIGRSLPIYWGDPTVTQDFNPASFLNYFDYKNEKELIDHIIAIDQDDKLLLDYLNAPALHHAQQIEDHKIQLVQFLAKLFTEAQQQRSSLEHTLFQIDRWVGLAATKRFRRFSRAIRKKG